MKKSEFHKNLVNNVALDHEITIQSVEEKEKDDRNSFEKLFDSKKDKNTQRETEKKKDQ